MKPFKAITTVYSYYMPEVRELITDLTREYPHDVFLRSISPGLDDFHHPVIDKLVAAHAREPPTGSIWARKQIQDLACATRSKAMVRFSRSTRSRASDKCVRPRRPANWPGPWRPCIVPVDAPPAKTMI